MAKQVINSIIAKLKKANLVTKVSPWLFEQGEEVRYVGLRIEDWQEIMSAQNNVLAKFIVAAPNDKIQLFLANKPPFILLSQFYFQKSDKWEPLFGEVKRKLNRDKQEYLKKLHQIDNLYVKLLPQLKK